MILRDNVIGPYVGATTHGPVSPEHSDQEVNSMTLSLATHNRDPLDAHYASVPRDLDAVDLDDAAGLDTTPPALGDVAAFLLPRLVIGFAVLVLVGQILRAVIA
jgi:hypothetical protein